MSEVNSNEKSFEKKDEASSQNGENEPLYSVEEILRRKIVKNKKFYLIKWHGYSLRECTWEPEENLICKEMVEEFERQKAEQQIENEKRKQERQAKLDKEREKKLSEKKDNENDKITISKISSEESDESNISKESEDFKATRRKKFRSNGFRKRQIRSKISPKSIITAKINENKSIDFLVEWGKDSDGETKKSYIDSKTLKSNNYYDLMIDYYESILKFQQKNAI